MRRPRTEPLPPPRERMIRSAAALFRERGVAATGFREVAAHSGVSRGSISHHFPDGKTELIREAIAWSGASVRDALEQAVARGDPLRAVREFVELWRCALIETHLKAGCTIAAVATETHEPELLALTAETFRGWREPFAETLRAAGVPGPRASRLATAIIAALEGALILSRAEQSTRPLIDTGQELEALVASALTPATRG